MLTKGMLMVIIGIGGLVITIIAGIIVVIKMRKNEFAAQNGLLNNSSSYSGNTGLNSSISQETDVITPGSINDRSNVTDLIDDSRTGTEVITGTGTDVLAAEQTAAGTDILEPQGTVVLDTKTTVISD